MKNGSGYNRLCPYNVLITLQNQTPTIAIDSSSNDDSLKQVHELGYLYTIFPMASHCIFLIDPQGLHPGVQRDQGRTG